METAATSTQYGWNAPETPTDLRHVVLFGSEGAITRTSLDDAIERELGTFAPDAVAVPGWSSATALAITRWAVKHSIPVIAMSESNAWDFSRNPATEYLKQRIAEYFSAGLCTSDGQAAYLLALGLPADAIFRGYNAVDNDYFAREAARAKGSAMPAGDHGQLPEAARGRYFLASCRFIAKKNLGRMLEAYALFRRDRRDDASDWPLILLGDGELRPALEKQRKLLRLETHVHLPGFRQYEELPAYYGSAGCFVHASTTEQWGLVVNEAMAAGLPVIVSDRSGCCPVLVRDGINGYSFAPDDVAALVDAMRSIAAQPEDEAMRRASRALIAEWGPDRFGRGIAAAAEYAAGAPTARPSLIARAAMALAVARTPLR
ncbi:glycosyltransferase family 4 protein [Sphingomonas oligophenolica]|uniref:Glycosyltransferase family 4 protein n=1 Tax=Sphingomonas oligophenolica TaxID=301154 RepID=A0ABU9YBY9_9SPHN